MYNFDYIKGVLNLLPPDKRTANEIAWQNGLVKQTTNLHVNTFNYYKDYTLQVAWTAGLYMRGSVVRYGNSIYQSVKTTYSEPSTNSDWVEVSPNFLGTDFRLAIRSEKMSFEYALNAWFNTAFRQPPAVSDIFITTHELLIGNPFVVGITESESSTVSTIGSSENVVNNYTFGNQNAMTINIPTAVFNALGTDDSIRTSIVRSFADKYVTAGIFYNIITY